MSAPSFAPFMSECPLFHTPGGGNLFILNVRATPGHHCHNLLGRMSESPGLPMEPLGIHIDWCITDTWFILP